MSLINALDSALSGLNLNQKSIYLSSLNISHAGDKDYYRLESELGSDRIGDVSIRRIKVVMDQIIEQGIIEQNSVVGYYNIKDFFLERVADVFGSPTLPDQLNDEIIPKNISTAVEDFFDKINMLSSTAESSALKIAVVNSAHHLSHIMHHTATTLQNLRLQADQLIKQSCYHINQNLREIHNINHELLYIASNDEQKAQLELSRVQAIQKLSEHIDIASHNSKDGAVHISTTNGQVLLGKDLLEIGHNAFHELDLVLEDKDFTPITLKSEFEEREIDFTKIESGKIKALVELRDVEIKDILSRLDEFASKITAEVNNIYSAGNTFPGHKKLLSQGDIADYSFTGKVKFTLLNEDGNHAIIDNDYYVRSLTVDLQGKSLQQITEEMNKHYSFGDRQVKIADHIDNIQLIPIEDTAGNFAFNLKIDNAKHQSKIDIQKVSILYDENKIFSKNNDQVRIEAAPYEVVKTKVPIALDIDDLPSSVKEFTVRIKINVGGVSTDVDYIINSSDIQDYYTATNIIGNDDAQIMVPAKQQCINAQFTHGVFSINANSSWRLAIEDISSNSEHGNFFHALKTNNLFVESREVRNSAFNFAVEKKLISHPDILNVANITYNKNGFPKIGIAKRMIALSNSHIDFHGSIQYTFYSFATSIIEKTAFKAHDATINKEHQLSFQEALDDEQKKVSGVNIDEEIAKSMFLKNWHEALTNIVQLVDKMFAELVNII